MIEAAAINWIDKVGVAVVAFVMMFALYVQNQKWQQKQQEKTESRFDNLVDRFVTHQFPQRVAGHLGFLFLRIPTGFSTGLKSRQPGGTMSRSLLSSALRVTEIERLMSYHDLACHDR